MINVAIKAAQKQGFCWPLIAMRLFLMNKGGLI
jgi:hypothetical protein